MRKIKGHRTGNKLDKMQSLGHFETFTVVIETDVTLYLLIVLAALKVIQCIILISLFLEIFIGS